MLRVRRTTIAAYLLPTFIAVSVINLFPILYVLYTSFTNKTLYRLDDYTFVGLENYGKVFEVSNGGDFYYVIFNTIMYVVACVALFLILGLTTALAVNNKAIKGQAFWRTALILPWTMPSVVTALIWKFLFDYNFGPVNNTIRIFAGKSAGVNWLDTQWPAFVAVVLVNVWLSYPFFMIVCLGALQSIPAELNEAASMDGANAWQRFRNITLPLLRPAITPAAILSAITTFQMFNTVYLLTQGGPITSALRPGFTTYVIVYYYLKLFGAAAGNPKYGQMSAVAVVIFVILFLMTLISLRVTNLAKEAQA